MYVGGRRRGAVTPSRYRARLLLNTPKKHTATENYLVPSFNSVRP